MTLVGLLRIFSIAALTAAPWTVLAQQASDCTGSVSISPATPFYGQPVTVTLSYQSLVVPTSPVNTQYSAQAFVYEQGDGTPSMNPVLIYLSTTPAQTSFTFTPYYPGNVSVSFGASPYGNYNLIPICGYGTGLGGTVNFAYLPVSNMFKGQYAFSFQGISPQVKGGSSRLAAVGSITADGQGNVTGTEDVNSGAGSVPQLPVTGTYTLDLSGNGTLKLATSLGLQQLDFFVPTEQLTRGVTKANLISTDGYFVFGNGSLVKQTLPSSATIPTGNYAINLSGDFSCTSTCSSGDPVYETGDISISSGNLEGTLTGSIGSLLLPSTYVSGTPSTSSDPTTGRFTYSLSQGPFPVLNFVGYPLDTTHFYTMSTDSHASTYLLSGTASQ